MLLTSEVCPSNTTSEFLSKNLQTLKVLSKDPEMMYSSFISMATQVIASKCPVNTVFCLLSAKLQIFKVLSKDPETMNLSS